MSALRIGFIGLGVMGTPMATHLAKAGHTLTLLDAEPGRAEALASTLGAPHTAVRKPREVGERSDVVITMLPNGQVVQSVALGDDGLVHGMAAGSLLLAALRVWFQRTR